MIASDFSHLTIDSSLKDLPSYGVTVNRDIKGQDILDMFVGDHQLPGVLILQGNILLGAISREMFFESTGKLYGTEVFLKRPIHVMLTMLAFTPLVLPENMLISMATQQALERPMEEIYHPIVIHRSDNSYRLVSALMIFMAQNSILLTVHNQRLFTVHSGLEISDDEALLRFRRFANIGNGQAKMNLLNRHAVRCDNCGQLISYTVPDIVRSHPQLSKGVIISDRMGSRFYLFYVRHQCANGEIREIPVQHDQNLEYRSQRPSRIIDSYV